MAEGAYCMKDKKQVEFITTKVTCGCGQTFEVKSTKPELFIEVCSACHPFYTGEQGTVSKTGRVDKFNRKYGLNQDKKAA